MNEPPPIEPKTAALPLSAEAAKLARLRRKAKFWRRIYRLIMLTPVFFWSIAVFAFFLHMFAHTPLPPDWFFNSMIAASFMGVFSGIPTSFWNKAVADCQVKIDIEAIGIVADGLCIKDAQSFAQRMLTGFLPRLQASDAHLLNARQHHLINRVLNGRSILHDSERTAFIFAVLKSYEQIGGTEDLPTVERLAQGKGYAKRDSDVRKAAQECLPYLQARSEVQDLRQTLLRASSVSAENSANLLRPAAASSETAPRELLRPAEPEANRKRNET